MYIKRIIEDIERSFTQYAVSESDTLLYYRTRSFLTYILSFEVVKKMLDKVRHDYPFDESILIDGDGMHKLPQEIIDSVACSEESYVSFLLWFLDWTFKKDNYDTTRIHDDATWTCSSDNIYNEKEKIRLFQQDVVGTIVNYIIDKLRKGFYICNVLEKFSMRASHFNCLHGVKNEHDIQDRIGLYLLDCGCDSHREEKSGNGNPDFLISNEDGLFVVEIKFVKSNSRKGEKALERWTSQLRHYMSKYSSYQGILYIVSERNCEYIWKNAPSNMSIMNVYIGKDTPSKLEPSNKVVINL